MSNSDQGTVLRVPLGRHGKAGEAQVVAKGLPVIDDFTFTGCGDTLLAALNRPNEVALVKEDGTHTLVLDGQDGLPSPTSIAVRGNTFLVANAAYNTDKDPNLLQANLTRRQAGPAQRARGTSNAVSATCGSMRCSPDSRSQSRIRSMARKRW